MSDLSPRTVVRRRPARRPRGGTLALLGAVAGVGVGLGASHAPAPASPVPGPSVHVTEPDAFQHIPIGDMECTLCHNPQSMNSGTWTFSLELPGGPAERTATFPHVKHAPLGCTTCHGRPPQPVQEDFTCGWTCHTPHLQAAEIDCRVCHQPPPQWAHEYGTVHKGCSGSLCHSLPVEEILPWRRPLCMVCHQDLEAYIPEVPPPGERLDTLRRDTIPASDTSAGPGGS